MENCKEIQKGRPSVAQKSEDVAIIAFKSDIKNKQKLDEISDYLGLSSTSELIRLITDQLINAWDEQHILLAKYLQKKPKNPT